MKIKLPYFATESSKEAEFRRYTEGKEGLELTQGLQSFYDDNKFDDMVTICCVFIRAVVIISLYSFIFYY